LTTKYVSLGSVLSVFVFFLSVLLMGKSGILFPFSEAVYLPMCGLSLFLALLCLFQHRENMKRLMNGTENKFGKNK
jgi:glycerol-3-phosphate O-acyltransferase